MESTLHNIELPRNRTAAHSERGKKYSTRVANIASKKDYTAHESALAVAGDDAYQKEVEKTLAPLAGARYVVLIGIGGSSLGAEAVFQAVGMQTNPQLTVLDAVDPEALDRLERFIAALDDPEELAVVVVSKSGNTTETVTNAAHFISALEARFGKDARDRVVFVGTKGGDFIEEGNTQKVRCLTIPEPIGGRYSVFTAAGIAPLTILRVDIASFLEGATAALEKTRRDAIVERAAVLAALAEEKGIDVVNFFTFNKRLRLLGNWYRQLIAESIGKSMTTDGATFAHQLLPVITTSVELHSVAQLYLGGYDKVFTHFVYADTRSGHHAVADHWTLAHTPMLKDTTPDAVREAIRTGVLAAYDDQHLPYRKTVLPKITAYELGLFMGLQMFEVMVLGHLFNVNVFDQPNVESYKEHTRAHLERTKQL